MNTKMMKAIDCYVGVPICFVLGFVRKIEIFFRLFFTKKQADVPKQILIMKFFGMGSILLASPLIKSIKKQYPLIKIGFLTFSENQDIVDRLSLVDNVYSLRTDNPTNFIVDLIKSIWKIRKQRYDITIDMEFFSKFSTIMTYISGSRIKIGYFLRQMWRGNLLTHHVYYNHYKHITEVFGALASPIGIKISDYTLSIPKISEIEDSISTRILEKEGVASKDVLIGFNVNVSDLSHERRWPMQSFKTLAEMLLNELDIKIVFIGTPMDIPYVSELIHRVKDISRIVNLAGKTNLGELVGVLGRLSLFITNDSGPLHIATALSIPTVSFFGPETPTLYGPISGNNLVFYKEIYCSPCLNVFNVKTAPCNGHNVCMQTIEPEEVIATIRSHFNILWRTHRFDNESPIIKL